MIKYATFKIDHEKLINNFLEENSDGVPVTGIRYVGDNVCFMYTSPDEKDQSKESLLASIGDFISKKEAELLGLDVDERYWRKLAAKGVKNASANVLTINDQIDNLKIHIELAKEIRKEVIAGTWPKVEAKKK